MQRLLSTQPRVTWSEPSAARGTRCCDHFCRVCCRHHNLALGNRIQHSVLRRFVHTLFESGRRDIRLVRWRVTGIFCRFPVSGIDIVLILLSLALLLRGM